MMAAKGPPLLDREDHPSELFFLHEAPQREWHVAHAVWFWAMGVGSAAFVLRQGCAAGSVGRPFGLDAVDLLGIALVACAGLVLILDLGRPLRLLGALLRPRRSWISRGAVADSAPHMAPKVAIATMISTVAGRPNVPFVRLGWPPKTAANSR